MSHYGTITTALESAHADGRSIRLTAEHMLEALVDRMSFAGVLDILSDIAVGKATHHALNWQDAQTARSFADFADRLTELSNQSPE